MRALVVGGDGMVGSALVAALKTAGHEVASTTRRMRMDAHFLDLRSPISGRDIPEADVVFIVAAVGSFQGCEGNFDAYLINVDAPIEIARIANSRGAFPVFVSSDCVEWCGSTAYARQKALAEIGVRMAGGAVVRPKRIQPHRVGEFCELLVTVGERRQPGVVRWS